MVGLACGAWGQTTNAPGVIPWGSGGFGGATVPYVYPLLDTNGVIIWPTNFWAVNAAPAGGVAPTLNALMTNATLKSGSLIGVDASAAVKTYAAPALNPKRDFAAAGDGVTDDLPAMSNAFAAWNAGPIGVLDLGGATYKVSGPLSVLVRPNMAMRHGTFLFSGTGKLITKTNANSVPGGSPSSTANFEISHVNFYKVGGAPDATCAAIVLGETNAPTPYSVNTLIQHCEFTNWWIGVEIVGAAQTEIRQSTFRGCWSNFIHVAKSDANPDCITIQQNLLDNSELGFYGPISTNCIAVQLDQPVFNFTMEGCNGNGMKQILLGNPNASQVGGSITFQNCNWGGLYPPSTNVSPVELWNPSGGLTIRNIGLTPTPVSSNFYAFFGCYATGAVGRLNMRHWDLRQLDDMKFSLFSTNEADGWNVPVYRGNNFTVNRHAAMGDWGTPTTHQYGTASGYQSQASASYGESGLIAVDKGLVIWNNGTVPIIVTNGTVKLSGGQLFAAAATTLAAPLIMNSNGASANPGLAAGQVQFWSSNGVLYAVCKDPGGTVTTNKLAP